MMRYVHSIIKSRVVRRSPLRRLETAIVGVDNYRMATHRASIDVGLNRCDVLDESGRRRERQLEKTLGQFAREMRSGRNAEFGRDLKTKHYWHTDHITKPLIR